MGKNINDKIKNLLKIKKNRKRGIHRSKRNIRMKVSEFFYPSIGFKALIKYMILSLIRNPGTSHQIALGFAIGVFVSFTPYIGLHSSMALALAYFLSANMLASVLGTIIGNPWTLPFIWKWTLALGNFILYQSRPSQHQVEASVNLVEIYFHKFSYYWDTYLYPMTVGGIPIGLVLGFISYMILKYNIEKFREIRKNKLALKKAEIRRNKLKRIAKSFSIKKGRKK